MLDILTNFSRNNWARKRVGGDISNSEITRFIKIQSVKFKFQIKNPSNIFRNWVKVVRLLFGQIMIVLIRRENHFREFWRWVASPLTPISRLWERLKGKREFERSEIIRGYFPSTNVARNFQNKLKLTYFHYFSGGDTGKNLPKTFAFRKREYESPAKVNFRLVWKTLKLDVRRHEVLGVNVKLWWSTRY